MNSIDKQNHKSSKTPAVPLKHAGQWIAWNQAQTKIIAAGKTLPDVRKGARQAGECNPVFGKAPQRKRLLAFPSRVIGELTRSEIYEDVG